MKFRSYIILFAIALLVAGATVIWQRVPGYMDSEYYYVTGMQLINGEGFSEPFLWNYLDGLYGIPHPSHTYWMPLTSILSAVGMWFAQNTHYFYGRILFVVMSAFLAPISAHLAVRYSGKQTSFWLGGFLAACPGMFIVFSSVTDSTVPVMLLGGLILLIADPKTWVSDSREKKYFKVFFLGLLAGSMHLARADGVIWVVGLIFWGISVIYQNRKLETNNFRVGIAYLALLILGYGLIMFPWYNRNISLYGQLFPLNSNRMLMVTNYNQTFTFYPESLTINSWLQAGWPHHFEAWFSAITANLGNLLAIQGSVILLPISLIGIFSNRRRSGIILFVSLWVFIFLAMTFVFPYAGARGGYLHSASAMQILIWALVPAGLIKILNWGKRVRGWKPITAYHVFAAGLILLQVSLTFWFYTTRVIGGDWKQPVWSKSYNIASELGVDIQQLGFEPNDIGMVNNPPGYFLATNLRSAVIPGGGLEETMAASKKLNAKYIIIEKNQENLIDLYQNPGSHENLTYIGEYNEAQIYAFR